MKFENTANKNILIAQLSSQIENELINLSPKYQRGLVWNARFKRDLIISLLQEYPIGYLITRKNPSDAKGVLEIVNGQQRLQCIYDFIKYKTKFGLNNTHGELAKNILNERNHNKNNPYKNPVKTFEDLNERDKDMFNLISIPTHEIWTTNHKAIKDYFDKIQNQERLKAGELISSMPNTFFDDLIDTNESVFTNFKENINYSNNRKEIIKLIFANFGYVNKLLDIGSSDGSIIKFSRQSDQVPFLFLN